MLIDKIVSEVDAYILLMNKVPILKPLAWLIGLPLIRPILAKLYHWQVNRRLKARGSVLNISKPSNDIIECHLFPRQIEKRSHIPIILAEI